MLCPYETCFDRGAEFFINKKRKNRTIRKRCEAKKELLLLSSAPTDACPELYSCLPAPLSSSESPSCVPSLRLFGKEFAGWKEW